MIVKRKRRIDFGCEGFKDTWSYVLDPFFPLVVPSTVLMCILLILYSCNFGVLLA